MLPDGSVVQRLPDGSGTPLKACAWIPLWGQGCGGVERTAGTMADRCYCSRQPPLQKISAALKKG